MGFVDWLLSILHTLYQVDKVSQTPQVVTQVPPAALPKVRRPRKRKSSALPPSDKVPT